MKQRTRKLVMMLASLLAAILLWLYVVTSVAPEATTRISGIEINLDGTIVLEERGLIITSQDADMLSLELSTPRVNLSKLNAKSIRVNADASKIREPGEYTLPCVVASFPDTVRSSNVQILRKVPDSVKIKVSKLVSQPVPIKLNLTGSVKTGYSVEAGSAMFEPEEIVVVGPEEEVHMIDKAVVSYDVSSLEETTIVSLPVVFLNADGEEIEFSEHTTVSPPTVNLTLPVLRTREIKMGVQLQAGGGVRENNAIVTVNPKTIRVKGAADVIEALDDPFLLGTVDLSEITSHEERTFPLALPAGVTNISGESEVSVTIDLKGVSSASIPISDIRIINAPEGYRTELSTRTVSVNVRGGTEEINELKQNKNNGIYILVDLTDYTQDGAFTVTGKIVNETHPSVSVGKTVDIGIVITSNAPQPSPED